MRLLHTLPILVIPITTSGDYNKVLDALEAVLAADTPLLRTARNPKHTEHAVRMATTRGGMLSVKWTNPVNQRWLMVVAFKHEYETAEALSAHLTGPTAETLAEWVP